MKTTSRNVDGIEILSLQGKITIGSGDVQLRDLIAQCLNDGSAVVRIDPELEEFPRDGAIHGTGVDHDEVQLFRKQARESALAGCGGPVDGDGAVEDHTGTVGRS